MEICEKPTRVSIQSLLSLLSQLHEVVRSLLGVRPRCPWTISCTAGEHVLLEPVLSTSCPAGKWLLCPKANWFEYISLCS